MNTYVYMAQYDDVGQIICVKANSESKAQVKLEKRIEQSKLIPKNSHILVTLMEVRTDEVKKQS